MKIFSQQNGMPDQRRPMLDAPISGAATQRDGIPKLSQGLRAWFGAREPAEGEHAIGRQLTGLDWGIAVLICVLSSTLLLILEQYLQNAHIGTTNGLWESIGLRHWIANPNWRTLDLGNAIYFPVYGMLCQALDRLGVFPGLVWRQMAVLDALFASLGLAGVYLFTAAWLRDRAVALLAVIFYGGSGFYLLCSILDEWDMPSQSFILFATLLACAWFARPGVWRIAAVAILFSVSWLFEWRFLLPALPPMLLTLFLAPGVWWQRITRPALFLVFTSLLPFGLAAAYFLTNGVTRSQAGAFFVKLFWVGKGVGSGWGGFSTIKIPLAFGGVAESLLGARYIGPWMISPNVVVEIICGLMICLALLAISLRYLWRHRTNDTVVLACVLLGGTLVAGTVLNVYSQPQDPQMLINVMIWTVPAWGLVANAVLGPVAGEARKLLGREGCGWHWRSWGRAPLIALVLLLPAYNVSVMAQQRGMDTKYVELVTRLGQRFDPQRTFFLYQGMEGIATWQFASWDGSWSRPEEYPPAPTSHSTFKIIAAISNSVNHPTWSVEHQVSDLKLQIDTVFDRGYQVVAGPELLKTDEMWVNGFLTVASPEVPKAIRRMIEENFIITPVYDDEIGGKYAIMKHKAHREP